MSASSFRTSWGADSGHEGFVARLGRLIDVHFKHLAHVAALCGSPRRQQCDELHLRAVQCHLTAHVQLK